jgi:hypothetical protein
MGQFAIQFGDRFRRYRTTMEGQFADALPLSRLLNKLLTFPRQGLITNALELIKVSNTLAEVQSERIRKTVARASPFWARLNDLIDARLVHLLFVHEMVGDASN